MHGIPDVIVSDNGTAFTSEVFKTFAKKNLIRHVTVAPYNPRANGEAERSVQTAKEALKRMTGNWNVKLARFLLRQHVTPSATTGLSPAELLVGRKLRTCLDKMHPDLIGEQLNRERETVLPADVKEYNVGDQVYARDYSTRTERKWMPAIIDKQTGPLSYAVDENGHVHRRHSNQLRGRNSSPVDVSERVTEADQESQADDARSFELASEDSASRPTRERRSPGYLKDYVRGISSLGEGVLCI